MAGRPLDPDKPVCFTPCRGVEADPKTSRLFLWIFIPDPPTFAANLIIIQSRSENTALKTEL